MFSVFLILNRPGQVCPQPPLLVPQVQDGRPQPQLGDLPPYELPVLGVDDPESHQTVLVHPDQAAPSNLLLQETLGVEMVIVTAVSPQPLLDVDNGPGEEVSMESQETGEIHHLPLLDGLGSLGIGGPGLLGKSFLHSHFLKKNHSIFRTEKIFS